MRNPLGKDTTLELRAEDGTTRTDGPDHFRQIHGKTYQTVHLEHPEYCDWILRTAETGDNPSQQLLRLARYLATKEARSTEDIPAGRMDDEL